MLLTLLTILAICSAAAAAAAAIPLSDTFDERSALQDQKMLSLSAKTRTDIAAESSQGANKIANDELQSILPRDETHENESDKKGTIRGRKRKAILLDYPAIPRILHHRRMPMYRLDCNDKAKATATRERLSGGTKRYQESNIFYIRLPPTPYMFVPGLGYISQPPTYSTAVAPKPQMVAAAPQLPQLPQLAPSDARPARPLRPTVSTHQTVNPFIKVPVDFASNGKPTSVYQWQKKPGKKPADSPITNLANLSADFVSNGKPTSIYQWQANFKPAKRPDDSLNSLDMGPYAFNGKPTSLYLLGSDGSSSMHRSVRHPDYQNDYSLN